MFNTTCDECKKSIEIEKESVYIRYTNKDDWTLGRDGHLCKNCGKSLIAFVKKQKWWKREKSTFEKEWKKKAVRSLLPRKEKIQGTTKRKP